MSHSRLFWATLRHWEKSFGKLEFATQKAATNKFLSSCRCACKPSFYINPNPAKTSTKWNFSPGDFPGIRFPNQYKPSRQYTSAAWVLLPKLARKIGKFTMNHSACLIPPHKNGSSIPVSSIMGFLWGECPRRIKSPSFRVVSYAYYKVLPSTVQGEA